MQSEVSAVRALPFPERRRDVVRRVMTAAAELERCARGAGPRPARRLVLETTRGCLEMRDRRRLLLGRGSQCDLLVPGSGVSRQHAAVVQRNGEYWIEDLGSANGTWHQGQRVVLRRIGDGDELLLHDAPVRFHLW